ncbi:glycosyl transferase family 90 [Phocaeicola sp.]
MAESFLYKLNSGKPIKFLDFIKNFSKLIVPDSYYRGRLQSKIEQAAKRPDYAYIMNRVNYYIRINAPWKIAPQDTIKRERSVFHYTGSLGGYHRKMFHTAYYFDQHDVTRWFPKELRWNFCPGDVYFTPNVPTVVKSRLLTDDNQNSVILKLDKLRHFMFVHDLKKFSEKENLTIFRGKIRQSRVREKFLQLFFNHPMFDCGVVGKNEGCPDEWMKPKKTIREHLDYKFIMALEGNDVASNLKWVMSSNSIAVMTRPTCETWFMEGTLIPDYHYIEVKEDFSDLPQKLEYYIEHPEKAEAIIEHAHEYIDQFRDKEREELISLLVMDRYFKTSGQK